jgi:phospholipid-binding lipoprotein MlaA
LALAACVLLHAAAAAADGLDVAATSSVPEGVGELPDPLFDEAVEAELVEVWDPFEGGNRAVLRFNQQVDTVLWDPIAKAYRFVVPDVARRAIVRALANLNTPIYLVNHLLQGHPLDAAESLGAFFMNSTFGLAGFVDTASGVGLDPKRADFGQTLARIGVGSGPYLVFPILGPSTLRDGFGGIIDRAFHPLTYTLAFPVQLVWGGGAGFARRDAVSDAMQAMEESSVDFYAVLRSAYAQAREREIRREGD